MKWETFIKHRDRLYGQVHLALEDGTRCADNATAATCAGLLDRYDNLWRFAETAPGLDPTNNAAERALRPAVIARKVSQCSRAQAYSAFKSVLGTLQKSGGEVLEKLTRLIAPPLPPESAPANTS